MINLGVRNPKVREYILKNVPEILNKNPIFVKVYGEKFAKKRAKAEIITVYTNKLDDNCEGFHTSNNKSITICTSESEFSFLTPNEIVNNKKIQEIILHESIHAILERTKSECLSYKIKGGTGLLERYSNYINDTEIGRGLNEGFTEWLCEKCRI